MAWRQAWHLIGRSQGGMRLSCILLILMAHTSAAESFQGCPDSPQGLAVAEAAAAGVKDQGTPFVFQARVMAMHGCPDDSSGESCKNPVPPEWRQLCSFNLSAGGGWAKAMICDDQRKQGIVKYVRERGIPGFDEMQRFSPCDLWPLIKGKTLWIVGDSHSFDLARAAACFFLPLWDFDFEGALPYASESAAFEHLEKHVENYKPPACFPFLEATMVCQIRVNKGQMFRDHVLPLIKRMAKPTDIAVMNFAHWHNGWEGHEYKDLLQAFRDEVAASVAELPHIIWKEMVPTHFKHLHGSYKGGDPPFECGPLNVTLQQDGTLKAGDEVNELLVQGGAHNRAAREMFAGSDIIITDSWNATIELYDYHRNMPNGLHECGHYCFPGVPEMWLYYVYKAIQSAPWAWEGYT